MVRLISSETKSADKYLPPEDYTDTGERGVLSENLLHEIGNPSEKGRSGNTSLSGYIKEKTSGEALRGGDSVY